jgi:hypothetical protein
VAWMCCWAGNTSSEWTGSPSVLAAFWAEENDDVCLALQGAAAYVCYSPWTCLPFIHCGEKARQHRPAHTHL